MQITMGFAILSEWCCEYKVFCTEKCNKYNLKLLVVLKQIERVYITYVEIALEIGFAVA